MADIKAPSPAPFSLAGAPGLPERPALLGGRCSDCGYVFFPMQAFGCERCGGQSLEPSTLAGRGKLVASATVFVPAGEHRPAPFTVGAIVIEDGALVRALLEVAAGETMIPGVEMVTKLVPETRSGRGQFDLRFARASEG